MFTISQSWVVTVFYPQKKSPNLYWGDGLWSGLPHPIWVSSWVQSPWIATFGPWQCRLLGCFLFDWAMKPSQLQLETYPRNEHLIWLLQPIFFHRCCLQIPLQLRWNWLKWGLPGSLSEDKSLKRDAGKPPKHLYEHTIEACETGWTLGSLVCLVQLTLWLSHTHTVLNVFKR